MDAAVIDDLADRCREPVVIGVDDCGTFAADHLLRRTGCDLMAPLRAEYAAGCDVDARGGLVRLVLRMVRISGWGRIDPAVACDPALGLGHRDGEWFCAIAVAPGWWAARGAGGLTVMRHDPIVRAWVCPSL